MAAMRRSNRKSFIRDGRGNVRQSLITRGPGSVRHARKPGGAVSWTKEGKQTTCGHADSVMIEDYTNQQEFLENIKLRYENDLIYTYIRGICISMNPYQDLDMYTGSLIDEYHGADFDELPPHLYAVANQAYYEMKEGQADQCILISGESGAGKTEAAKQILQFFASTATDSGTSGSIRDRLLQANPILEAFGNAKTLRNDNSSRFGKYMEIQFDFKGEPLGGRIINYLLEKSRVVHQLKGERNYHIFYMLLAGATDDWKAAKSLALGPECYHYTAQGEMCVVPTLSDKDEWDNMFQAMLDVGIDASEREALLEVAAFVLLLGQVEFAGADEARVADEAACTQAAGLVGVEGDALADALTHSTIVTRGESLKSPLKPDKAKYARNALAKTLYDRTFTWLVGRLNSSLAAVQSADQGRRTVMGLLDIYGFEILSSNGFEQICINYCNEKLQQLFIELTLKSEQEEYRREGITWEPIEYFDNEVICQLIESPKNPVGMITTLDDCCLGPGSVSDDAFLLQLDKMFGKHAHYASFATDKAVGRTQFVVKHYAGDVAYTVHGFMDANNDLLFRDLKSAMLTSTSPVINDCFKAEELESKKRPPTAGTQFRASMHALMDTLMAKEPSYIRCIKPNGEKKPNCWNQADVEHQVQYLGLMESLRVARAGYCYRRKFEYFLQRYKSLAPATWPTFSGSPKEGVQALAEHLIVEHGFAESEIAVGNTKVFIRNPKTVVVIEKAFQNRKPALVTKIAARWRGYLARKHYIKLRAAAVTAQSYARVVLAKVAAEKRKKSVTVLRQFIKGFITRNDAPNSDNAVFIEFTRIAWLKRLANGEYLPKSVLDKRWMPDLMTPESCRDASKMLQALYFANMQRKYRLRLDAAKRDALTKKLLASELFAGRKMCYPASVGVPFVVNRIDEPEWLAASIQAYRKLKADDESADPLYSTLLHKFDRSTYKHKRDDVVILSKSTIRVFTSGKKSKLKFELPLASLTHVSLSEYNDGVIVIGTPGRAAEGDKKDKGDFMFDTPHAIEFATMIVHTMAVKPGPQSPGGEQSHGVVMPKVGEIITIAQELEPVIKGGKIGKIVFGVGEDAYEVVAHAGGKALKVSAPDVAGAEGFKAKVRRSLRIRAD